MFGTDFTGYTVELDRIYPSTICRSYGAGMDFQDCFLKTKSLREGGFFDNWIFFVLHRFEPTGRSHGRKG